jgi:hypothetical protein
MEDLKATLTLHECENQTFLECTDRWIDLEEILGGLGGTCVGMRSRKKLRPRTDALKTAGYTRPHTLGNTTLPPTHSFIQSVR